MSVNDILSLGTIKVLCIIAFAASNEVKHDVPLSTAMRRSLKPSRSGILPCVGVLIISDTSPAFSISRMFGLSPEILLTGLALIPAACKALRVPGVA